MSNNDSNFPNLRFDSVTQTLQYQVGLNWVDVPAGTAGVSSVNTLTGAVVLAAGSNITLTPSGNTITVAASGGSQRIPQAFQVLATGVISTTSSTYASTPLSLVLLRVR